MFLVAGLLAFRPSPVSEVPPLQPSRPVMPAIEPVPVTVEGEVRLTLAEMGRDDQAIDCALAIFQHESGLRLDVRGDGGESYGLGQRHAPAHGVPPEPWEVADQVVWFDDYAHDRYGSWCAAHDRWQQRAAERGGAGWW